MIWNRKLDCCPRDCPNRSPTCHFDYCGGDFGRNRPLSAREQDKYRSKFRQIDESIDMSQVRLVEFAWYNGVEAPGYYNESPLSDRFYDEI